MSLHMLGSFNSDRIFIAPSQLVPKKSVPKTSLCSQLSDVFQNHTLFLAHPHFRHSRLITQYQCTNVNENTATLSLDLTSNGVAESRKSKKEITVLGFERDKDQLHLKVAGQESPQTIQIANKTCSEFWKFLNKHHGHHEDLITSGGSAFHFLINNPSCRVVNHETRIYFTEETHKEVCYQRDTDPSSRICSSHIKIMEGARGCVEDGLASKNNCFRARGLKGELYRFYGDTFKEQVIDSKSKDPTEKAYI